MTAESPGNATTASFRRWRYAVVIVASIALAAVVVTWLVIRALPDEAEVQVEIAGWRVPAGVVVKTGDLRNDAPGLVLRSLLGGDSSIQINAGHLESLGDTELRMKSLADSEDAAYELTTSTRFLNARNLLGGSPAPPESGELVAIVTFPGTNRAVLVVTGVTETRDD